MCKRICEVVLAIVLIVMGLLNLSPAVHKWTLVVVGVVLIIHAFWCKRCCGASCQNEMPERPVARKGRRK